MTELFETIFHFCFRFGACSSSFKKSKLLFNLFMNSVALHESGLTFFKIRAKALNHSFSCLFIDSLKMVVELVIHTSDYVVSSFKGIELMDIFVTGLHDLGREIFKGVYHL